MALTAIIYAQDNREEVSDCIAWTSMQCVWLPNITIDYFVNVAKITNELLHLSELEQGRFVGH